MLCRAIREAGAWLTKRPCGIGAQAVRDIGGRTVQALDLYKVSDPVAYSNALWPILGDMLSLPQSNDCSGLGAVLQVAGKIMGSDEQLSDHPGHDNCVLDAVDARIWAPDQKISGGHRRHRAYILRR